MQQIAGSINIGTYVSSFFFYRILQFCVCLEFLSKRQGQGGKKKRGMQIDSRKGT